MDLKVYKTLYENTNRKESNIITVKLWPVLEDVQKEGLRYKPLYQIRISTINSSKISTRVELLKYTNP